MRWLRWAVIAAILAGVLIVVGLLLPVVFRATDRNYQRDQSLNNLKQIALAMANHESAFGNFPARAIFDKQGKPLLSWRVSVLPHLEYCPLYYALHLDEPWDSEHNRKCLVAIGEYRNPASKAPRDTANYLAVCGKGLMFDGTVGRKVEDIRDDTSHTIMVVEANDDRAVPWTKPEDWEYDPDDPLAGLGDAHRGGFNAAFADGSVRFIRKSIDPKLFHAMLTIAGGEKIDFNAIPDK
jgi:prepilin-type processing-associated H-X9-DG protein